MQTVRRWEQRAMRHGMECARDVCFCFLFTYPLGTKTIFFLKPNTLFSAWIYEKTKNIFWASEIVATHVERFYDLMNLKLFYFAW